MYWFLNNFDGEIDDAPADLTEKFSFKDLCNVLNEISGLKARLSIVSSFAAHHIHEMEDAVQLHIDGIQYFHDAATHPLDGIASDANVAERTVQIRFQKYTGYSQMNCWKWHPGTGKQQFQ